MPEFPLEPELAAVSRALGGLTPKPAALDRDRLLYEAGRRSVRPPSRTWPIVAGLFAVLSVGLGVRMATVPPRVEVVYLPHGEFSRDPERSGGERSPGERSPPLRSGSRLNDELAFEPLAGYLRLRDQVVRFGTDVLQTGTVGSSPPEPPVEYLLGLPAGTLSDSQKSRWQHQLFRGDV